MSYIKLPRSVIEIVSSVLSDFNTHDSLNYMFLASGAPKEIPQAKKKDKCSAWLMQCNNDHLINPLDILGKILEVFMEVDVEHRLEEQQAARNKINTILNKHNLQYKQSGRIISTTINLSTCCFLNIIKSKDLSTVEHEFNRILNTLEIDPPSALTAACSMVESLFKVYIEDEGLLMPSEQCIGPLWKVVKGNLGLEPTSLIDNDFRKILAGLSSTVDGLGSLRSHASSAHGKGRKCYKIRTRHARLAVHAAHALCVFILETWDDRKIKANSYKLKPVDVIIDNIKKAVN